MRVLVPRDLLLIFPNLTARLESAYGVLCSFSPPATPVGQHAFDGYADRRGRNAFLPNPAFGCDVKYNFGTFHDTPSSPDRVWADFSGASDRRQ